MLAKLEVKLSFCPYPKKFVSFSPILSEVDVALEYPAPKDASPVRMHNRCKITGRPKGFMRQFGISRVTFREMANKGLIPGVTKASW